MLKPGLKQIAVLGVVALFTSDQPLRVEAKPIQVEIAHDS